MLNNILKLYMENQIVINIIILVLVVLALVFGYIFREEIKAIYLKYKEIINYVIVGALTTVVSIGSYYFFRFVISNYVVLSILSWIAAVLFAYITNRIFVFESRSNKVIEEISKFIGSRLVTLGMEVVLMILFVSVFKINDMLSKIILQVVVLILNYLFSKLFVFKKS